MNFCLNIFYIFEIPICLISYFEWYQTVDFFDSLLGVRLVKVDYVNQSDWCFHFKNGAEIRPGSEWRIIWNGAIQASSVDDGRTLSPNKKIDAVANCKNLICGIRVDSVNVIEETNDLIITFRNGARLEIIPFSSEFESWQYSNADGGLFIANGSGGIYAWVNAS